jgi:adenylate cyclase
LLAQYYLAGQNIAISQAGDALQFGKTVVPILRSNDGGYVNDFPAGYAFLQDFRGPSKFDTLSIGEVRTLKDPSIFKGKIVLLGIDAGSSNDTFTTPISGRLSDGTPQRVPGVLVHAQIVNQLLRVAINGDKPTASRSRAFGWCWMAFWCLGGVVIGFFIRSHILFAVAAAVGVGLIVLAAWLQFLDGYWILVVGPAVVYLGTAMLAKAYAATHEEQKRKTVMRLFSQHVSPEVAEEMWAQRDLFLQGGRPAARELMVTVLFTDLKNYSTISEKMTPAELIAWINDCQGALAQHVVKNRGHINSYMGDGMMAVFGIPIPRKTETEMQGDAIDAVSCAVGMAGEIKKMNAVWRAEGKPLAGLRVGIYTGKAMTGILGVENKLAYSVIGDTVNTASRLESIDKEGVMTSGEKECRILIGALTYKYSRDRFPARHVGTVNLKGKAETTEVYNVLDSESEPEQDIKLK